MTAKRKIATTNYDAEVSPALSAFMRTNWADDPAPDVEPAEVAPYAAKRRAALSAAFPGRTLVIAAGAPKPRNGDTFFPFRPSSDFAWLTAETAPDSVLIMTPDADSPG